MKNTVVIYHRADFDGIFCREIARKFLGNEGVQYIGWDYGDPNPVIPIGTETIYMLDISVEGLMAFPGLIWIDHHKSAIEKFGNNIPGYRIDGVAACRLAWQWFAKAERDTMGMITLLPDKTQFVDRLVSEPLAVRLAGEYDIWDKRDSRADLFQHGLRSQELDADDWAALLTPSEINADVEDLLDAGKAIQYAQTQQNESIIKAYGFTFEWEGLTFLACNHARFNSHLFTAGLTQQHDACFGFNYDGSKRDWRISLYHAPGKEHHDLSLIATKYGGGGHRGACGFRTAKLPFMQ